MSDTSTNGGAEMIRFTTMLDDFATAVSNVALFAGTDDTLPVLTNVQLTVAGNVVTMAATDRYVLAVTDYELPADAPAEGSGEILLTPEMIKALDAARRGAKRLASNTPVTVTWYRRELSCVVASTGAVATDTVTIDVAYGATQSYPVAQHTWGGFPRWRALLPTSHVPCPDTSVAYNPAFIAKMAKIKPAPAHVKLSPASGRNGDGVGATRWQAGELRGLIMPIRIDDTSAVELPWAAAPAAVAAA